MKYIDADKLIANLERQNVDKKVIQPLIRIIDSLQQEQKKVILLERDTEDIFAHEYAIYSLPPFVVESIASGTQLIDFIYKTAHHFYELGQSQMPMPEDTVLFQKGVAEGRRLEREDSVECEVTDVGFNYLDLALFDAESLELKDGDKVKVIVLKDNEDESK